MTRTAGWLAILSALLVLPASASDPSTSNDAESGTPADLVAVQVREQGFPCADPVSAERDGEEDDDAVWTLSCADAAYRVRLIPDMQARIDVLY